MKKQLLHVEDDFMVGELVRIWLDERPEIEHLGLAGSLAQAKERLARTRPDILILDIALPDGRGTELLAQAANAGRQFCKVMVLAGSFDPIFYIVSGSGGWTRCSENPEGARSLTGRWIGCLRTNGILRRNF